MITYRVQQAKTETDFLTTDLIDVLNELEALEDGATISITKEEMTMQQFQEKLTLGHITKMTIKTPWKNGSE